MTDQQHLSSLQGISSQMLKEGFSIRATVGGNSMFPSIRKGDVSIIEACNIDDLLLGDIIVFKANNKFIAHRLLKIVHADNCTKLICKGDSCYKRNQAADSKNLIGKLIGFERGEKKVNFNTISRRRHNRFLAFISPIMPPFYFIAKKIRKLVVAI